MCDWKPIAVDDLGNRDWRGGQEGNQLGASVVISRDGSTVAIGSPGGLFQSLREPGHVQIFSIGDSSDGTMIVTKRGANIVGNEEGGNSGSAIALSEDGTVVAIGASQSRMGEQTNVGSVRVFRYDENSDQWNPVAQQLHGQAESDLFGTSVAINADGTILAVGAPGNDGLEASFGFDSNRGSAQVFTLSANETLWEPIGPVISGSILFEEFGTDVDLSSDGQILVSSSPRATVNGRVDNGQVTVFRFENGTWNPLGGPILGAEMAGDWFGRSVSVASDGKTIAAGAWLNDGRGPFSGEARIYTWNDGLWKILGNPILGELPGDQAGFSVSLAARGRIVAVGSIRNDGRNGVNSGSARVFEFNESLNEWLQIGSDLDGLQPEESFGHTVSLSGDGSSVLVGGLRNDGMGVASGRARMYTLDTPCPDVTEHVVNGIQMLFLGGMELRNESEIAEYQQITREFYQTFYSMDLSRDTARIRNLWTNVMVHSQNTEVDGNSTKSIVIYDQNISFVQLDGAMSLAEILKLPFNDEEFTLTYLNELVTVVPPLSGVVRLEPLVLPMSILPAPQEPTKQNDGRLMTIPGIVGTVLAALALVTSVLALICFRRQKPSFVLPEGFENLPVGEPIPTEPTQQPGTPMDSATVEAQVLGAEPPQQSTYKNQFEGRTEDEEKDIIRPDYKDQVHAR